MFYGFEPIEGESQVAVQKIISREIRLSISIDILEQMLKGEVISLEHLHFQDRPSKEAAKRLLLNLIANG